MTNVPKVANISSTSEKKLFQKLPDCNQNLVCDRLESCRNISAEIGKKIRQLGEDILSIEEKTD